MQIDDGISEIKSLLHQIDVLKADNAKQSHSVSAVRLRPRQSINPSDIIMGCGPPTGWGNDHDILDAAVHAALSSGIIWFDTAPLYGDSEDRLGHALEASPLGKNAQVCTKAGKLVRRLWNGRMLVMKAPTPWAPFALKVEERVLVPDYSSAGAALSLRESMERMGLQRCHTLRIHDPDSVEGAMAESVGEGGLIAGLRKLREEGKIKHVSFGMNANTSHKIVTPGANGSESTPWPGPQLIINMIRSVPAGTFDSALLAYGWNLLSQDGFEVIQECGRQGIKVHNAGAFSGLFHMNAGCCSPPEPSQITLREKVQRWRDLASVHGVSVEAVALAFAALPTVVDKVVLGMKTAEEVHLNVSHITEACTVPTAIWKEAQAAGLLAAHLPLP
jgi:D-threo-aldose 1-dehydrogenase